MSDALNKCGKCGMCQKTQKKTGSSKTVMWLYVCTLHHSYGTADNGCEYINETMSIYMWVWRMDI